MGVRIRPVDGALVREKGLSVNQGVYVDEATENGAAINSGIESGDVIVKVDNTVINSNPDLLEAIAQRRPGDAVSVTVNRNGAEQMFSVILNNRDGNTEIIQKELTKVFGSLGANFETLDKETAKKAIAKIKESKIKVQAQIQGEQLQVTGKKRDDLQAVMSMLKAAELDLPMQFQNFRD